VPARKGELHHKAKLTEQLVREARRLRTEDGLSIFKICERLDWPVSRNTMQWAIEGRTWRHLP
jgi:hypothetical protein